MYFHASQTEKIKILEPRISNHNIPFIYFQIKEKMFLCNEKRKFKIIDLLPALIGRIHRAEILAAVPGVKANDKFAARRAFRDRNADNYSRSKKNGKNQILYYEILGYG